MPKVVPSQIIEYIDSRFPAAKKQSDGEGSMVKYGSSYHAAVNTIIEMIEQLPQNLINLTGEDYIIFIEALNELKGAIAFWNSDHVAKMKYEIYKMKDGSKWNPITFLRNSLSKCPDQGIDMTASGLSFIDDAEFREALRQDISFVNQALFNAEWKAATILTGSVIEALLLYAINKIKENEPDKFEELRNKVIEDDRLEERLISKPPNNPNDWKLYQYIPFSLTAGTISVSTAKGCLVAKDFRNLIHPGVSIRKNLQCDRGTALKTIGGMEHVINDLSLLPI